MRDGEEIELRSLGMASVEDPLMGRGGDRGSDEEDRADDEVLADAPLPSSKTADNDGGPTLFVYLVTLSACFSGLLFGYDTGVISATLISINTSLSPPSAPQRPLTTLDKSLITSAPSLLALLSAPLASLLADAWGRRPPILLSDLLLAAGALAQARARGVAGLVAGRAVVGAGVGVASAVVPLYLAETAPARVRGRLVTLNVLAITAGQVVAYVVGWGFSGAGGEGWRWMVGLGAAPAVVQAVVVWGMPETPRWLVRAGRAGEARAVMRRVLGGGEREAEGVVRGIEREVRAEEQEVERARRSGSGGGRRSMGKWGELVRVRRNRRALVIACLLQGLQQLCGFNSLMYFSATIFQLVGFRSPTLASLTVAGTNFAFTVLALLLIDRIGRRRVLLYSIPFMIAGLLLTAYGFSFITLSRPNTDDPTVPPPPSDRTAALTILISIMLYVAAYALGLGNVPWMQSELFALDVRSLGSGVATATNWTANFIVGLTFLPLLEALTPSWTFVLYAGVCAVGYEAIRRVYPETSGLSLEEAATLLEGEGWGVR